MDKKELRKIIQSLSLITQLGLVMITNIGVGYFLGHFMDNILHFKLVFGLIGLILGVGSGFYAVYHLVKKFIGDDDVER